HCSSSKMFNHPKLSNSSYCSFCVYPTSALINVILKLIHQSLYAVFGENSVNKCSRNRCSFKSTNQGLGH
ncbi:hypothetical protein FXE71_17010, partial [Vibrio cholerae]